MGSGLLLVARARGDCGAKAPLFSPSPLEWAREETGELTDWCNSGGDSQGLPGYSNPCIIGTLTIRFQLNLRLYSQTCILEIPTIRYQYKLCSQILNQFSIETQTLP